MPSDADLDNISDEMVRNAQAYAVQQQCFAKAKALGMTDADVQVLQLKTTDGKDFPVCTYTEQGCKTFQDNPAFQFQWLHATKDNPGKPYYYWDKANGRCRLGNGPMKAWCTIADVRDEMMRKMYENAKPETLEEAAIKLGGKAGRIEKSVATFRGKKYDERVLNTIEKALEGTAPPFQWDDEKQQCNVTERYCTFKGVYFNDGPPPHCYEPMGEKVCGYVLGTYVCHMGKRFWTDMTGGHVLSAMKDLADVAVNLSVAAACVAGLANPIMPGVSLLVPQCDDMFEGMAIGLGTAVWKGIDLLGNDIAQQLRGPVDAAGQALVNAAGETVNAAEEMANATGKTFAEAADKTFSGVAEVGATGYRMLIKDPGTAVARTIVKGAAELEDAIGTFVTDDMKQAFEDAMNAARNAGYTVGQDLKTAAEAFMKFNGSVATAAELGGEAGIEELKKMGATFSVIANGRVMRVFEHGVENTAYEAAHHIGKFFTGAGEGIADGAKGAWHSVSHFLSDARLKRIVRIVRRDFLGPGVHLYLYRWKPESGRRGFGLGFLAQEVRTVYPGSVVEDPATHYLRLHLEKQRALTDERYAAFALIAFNQRLIDHEVNKAILFRQGYVVKQDRVCDLDRNRCLLAERKRSKRRSGGVLGVVIAVTIAMFVLFLIGMHWIGVNWISRT